MTIPSFTRGDAPHPASLADVAAHEAKQRAPDPGWWWGLAWGAVAALAAVVVGGAGWQVWEWVR